MDIGKHFDAEYRTTLLDIQSNFQQNLNRNMENDILRDVNRKFTPKTFQNVSAPDGIYASNVELTMISLITPVLIESGQTKVDLLQECVICDYELKELTVEANYSGEAEAKVTFSIYGTLLSGRVGLFRREDSFVPLNYDIKLLPKEIKTLITYNDSSEEIVDVSSDVVETMVNLFWIELYEFVMRNFARTLSGNVVEYSFGEMFLDEPEKYMAFELERIQMANNIFDEKLKQFVDVVRGCAKTNFKGRFSSGGVIFNFQAVSHELKNMSSLRRVHDASWFDNDVESSVYASTSIQDFKFVITECVITPEHDSEVQVKGALKIQPDRNRINIKFQTLKLGDNRQCRVLVDLTELDISFVDLDELNCDISFSTHQQSVLPVVVGHLRQQTDVILQKHADAFNSLQA